METTNKQKNKHLTHLVNETAQAGNISYQCQKPKSRFQIIKLDEVEQINEVKEKSSDQLEEKAIPDGSADPDFENNLTTLFKLYPGKISYSIQDVSKIIGLSYEFVRESIKKGVIKSKKYGDRMIVNVHELARILTEGIS